MSCPCQLLALELLKVLLENSGPTFRGSEKFTAAIRQVRAAGGFGGPGGEVDIG
jgi:hypothetical protein